MLLVNMALAPDKVVDNYIVDEATPTSNMWLQLVCWGQSQWNHHYIIGSEVLTIGRQCQDGVENRQASIATIWVLASKDCC